MGVQLEVEVSEEEVLVLFLEHGQPLDTSGRKTHWKVLSLGKDLPVCDNEGVFQVDAADSSTPTCAACGELVRVMPTCKAIECQICL